MKTYSVQTRVEADDNTNTVLIQKFKNLEEAKECFSNELKKENASQYIWENQFKNSYQEVLEIDCFNDEDEDFETIEEEVIYYEGLKDKNNWKGEYANNYWTVAKHNGTELIYNFYDNSKDLNLEYADVKESELKNWYNYR